MRINSLEGIRTIGWIGVFLCHFRGAFFPNTIWITDNTPISFLYSGNAYVRVLFVISGFVLSVKYFSRKNYDSIVKDIVKRWFRLVPPVLTAELIVYFFMKYHLLFNTSAAIISGSESFLGIFNQFTPSISSCLKEALVSTYLYGANGYIGPLWTMVYEYLGAILVLCVIGIFKTSAWRFLFYIIFLCFFNGYYNYLILGMVLADLYINSGIASILKENNRAIGILIIVGYLMLSTITINDADKFSRVIFSSGIVVFFVGLLSSQFAERVLGSKLFIFGGKIAYSAYIVHWPIIESFSSALLIWGTNMKIPYEIMGWGICISTFFVVVIVATLFAKYIEPLGIKIVKIIFKG